MRTTVDPKVTLSAWVGRAERDELVRIARVDDSSVSEVVRRILAAHLERSQPAEDTRK